MPKGGWRGSQYFKTKCCAVCSTEFKPRNGVQKFCSIECKGKWKYITGDVTTESQYKLISGNWSRYMSRLLYFGGRKRDKLSREILLDLLEKQDYKCALSGIPLTCNLERGKKFWTNASIDRIEAGGPYTVDNIQLVCKGLNLWRSDLTVDEFVWWCKQVSNHFGEEGQVKDGRR